MSKADGFVLPQRQQQRQSSFAAGITSFSSIVLFSSSDYPADVEEAYEVDDDYSSSSSSSTTGSIQGKNRMLLDILATGTDNPFLKEDMDRIASLAKELEGTYILPLEKSDEPSQWKLLWTNAPDLLGIRGGPINSLVSIILTMTTENECQFSLTYKFSEQIAGLVSNVMEDVADDRLEQTLVFDYDMPLSQSPNKIQLKLKSTQITSTRFPFEMPSVPIVGGQLLPMTAVDIVFNDGNLRMDRTVQGDFLFLYQKL